MSRLTQESIGDAAKLGEFKNHRLTIRMDAKKTECHKLVLDFNSVEPYQLTGFSCRMQDSSAEEVRSLMERYGEEFGFQPEMQKTAPSESEPMEMWSARGDILALNNFFNPRGTFHVSDNTGVIGASVRGFCESRLRSDHLEKRIVSEAEARKCHDGINRAFEVVLELLDRLPPEREVEHEIEEETVRDEKEEVVKETTTTNRQSNTSAAATGAPLLVLEVPNETRAQTGFRTGAPGVIEKLESMKVRDAYGELAHQAAVLVCAKKKQESTKCYNEEVAKNVQIAAKMLKAIADKDWPVADDKIAGAEKELLCAMELLENRLKLEEEEALGNAMEACDGKIIDFVNHGIGEDNAYDSQEYAVAKYICGPESGEQCIEAFKKRLLKKSDPICVREGWVDVGGGFLLCKVNVAVGIIVEEENLPKLANLHKTGVAK